MIISQWSTPAPKFHTFQSCCKKEPFRCGFVAPPFPQFRRRRAACFNGLSTHSASVDSMRKLWAALLPMALGDGELFLSSSTTPALQTSSLDPSNMTYDCNPYLGTQYLIIGNGNGISSDGCTDSWDLYEIFLYDENGDSIYVTATSDDQDSGYEAFKAVDGSLTSFWAGDHDIGMSCGCWQSEKKDGQSILLYLQGNRKVSRIQLHQGGANDPWAVSKIRLHCAASFQANPLPLDISHGMTEITCNADGCGVTSMSIPYQHTCNGASMDKFSMLLVVLVLGQRLFA
ncbi:unnamed protein product [Durusdinium trenchii]|uniref:Uncharacterized protein n=1 Tax=Durusdinium trenchii TaxID=1381693 RepID=A0ABP0Q9Z8_9DINO